MLKFYMNTIMWETQSVFRNNIGNLIDRNEKIRCQSMGRIVRFSIEMYRNSIEYIGHNGHVHIDDVTKSFRFNFFFFFFVFFREKLLLIKWNFKNVQKKKYTSKIFTVFKLKKKNTWNYYLIKMLWN